MDCDGTKTAAKARISRKFNGIVGLLMVDLMGVCESSKGGATAAIGGGRNKVGASLVDSGYKYSKLRSHTVLGLKQRKLKPEKRALPSLSYPNLPTKMDRYHKVERPRAEQPIDENEIRITSQGRMRNYITYAMSLIQEKGSSEIVFKAMGRAINKTVTIVELIKVFHVLHLKRSRLVPFIGMSIDKSRVIVLQRRIVGLHQITAIGSTDITDTWEPLEEGLLPLETTRHVSMITITLSMKELNTSSIGYQPPLPADQVKVATEFEYEGEGSPTGRGRGRGGRGRGRGRSRAMPGNGYGPGEYDDGGWDAPRDYTRGRGRGRGRNFRGRGRGGYNNGSYVDDQYDGGYNQEVPMQGREIVAL
ncbi:DNA/RNA-binding protein Alba-like protein [Cynara cardunculus var. scolymus]|uniref:DNA/RNA-binding protein Alba-like protein n=1 Tax=Cynara cardunculus var. scolymus TaxID=59895 RepID=A0A103YER1_CYNCS|nr:DNA/RNA-binding protein Alba-like protein [Cynara cardunculus var. scolymus]